MLKRTIISIFLCSLFVLTGQTVYSKNHIYDDKLYVIFVRNYDGDTITVNIPNIPAVFGDNISIRLYGIDTPEMHGKCIKEKELARKAKKFVNLLLTKADKVVLYDIRRGKYFRIVAKVVVDGKDISELLLRQNLAVPYFGGTKTKNWCE